VIVQNEMRGTPLRDASGQRYWAMFVTDVNAADKRDVREKLSLPRL
jgi:hypothetical protein